MYGGAKLTPRECWRLMDFTDEDFNKADKNIIVAIVDFMKAFANLVVNLIKGEVEFSFNIDSIL